MEYGLIGEHLGHSFSKEIHEKLSDYIYELKELPREQLAVFLKDRQFKAINVTIPYKEAVIPYLDKISDEAAQIGAVNTIVNRNGVLTGYNTDYYGFELLAGKLGVSFKDAKVLILGAGGAAKAVRAFARNEGAKEIINGVRTIKAEGQVLYEDLDEDFNIIVNCTPVGMYPRVNEEVIDLMDFPRLRAVLDCIYNPLSTTLVSKAKAMSIPSEGGLYMLVGQAVKAVELFRDTSFESTETERIYRQLLTDKINIVLTGMPSCGKTTVGKVLAKICGKSFKDTDEIVRERVAMPIREFFSLHGESAFREIEKQVISELSLQQGQIIATGGGAAMDPDNIMMLKRNGVTVFLDTDLKNLTPTPDRPLSKDAEAMKKLYEERVPVYRAGADIVMDNNCSADLSADRILAYLNSF